MIDKQSSQTDSEPGSSEQTPANTSGGDLSVSESMTPARSSLRYGLDIHSCLQLLMDVYGSTLLPSPSSPPVPLTLFNETVRSVSYCPQLSSRLYLFSVLCLILYFFISLFVVCCCYVHSVILCCILLLHIPLS